MPPPLAQSRPSGLSAQDKIYVQIPGANFRGESADPAHPQWIEAFSLTHGATLAGVGAAPSYSSISFTKAGDRSSPFLFHAVSGALGTFSGDVVIDVCREPAGGSQQCYYRLTLRAVGISSHALSGSACIDPGNCGASQTESVSLDWTQAKWRYTQYDAKAGVVGTFEQCRDSAKNNFTCF